MQPAIPGRLLQPRCSCFSLCSFCSNRRLISSINSMSRLGSRSSAANLHSSSQRSRSSPLMSFRQRLARALCPKRETLSHSTVVALHPTSPQSDRRAAPVAWGLRRWPPQRKGQAKRVSFRLAKVSTSREPEYTTADRILSHGECFGAS